MKKWPRRCLIGVALIALTFGGLYEWSTHSLRGWWNGDATFQGRPTSYWRARIDTWAERFDTLRDAEQHLRSQTFEGLISSEAIIYTRPQATYFSKIRPWLGLAADARDDDPPAILIKDDEAEPVLCELERDPAMQRLVVQARKKRFLFQ